MCLKPSSPYLKHCDTCHLLSREDINAVIISLWKINTHHICPLHSPPWVVLWQKSPGKGLSSRHSQRTGWGKHTKQPHTMSSNITYDRKHNNILASETCFIDVWVWIYPCRSICPELPVYSVLVSLVTAVFTSLKFDYFWVNIYLIPAC